MPTCGTAIEKSWFGTVIIDEDAARAEDRLTRTAPRWGLTPGQMRERALVGTPAQVIERIRAYAAVGVTHFIGLFGRVEDLRGTRLFAERVLPAFR
jgi:alkanesulfonate monooxygenase SsuD/methylene tetrahydromethanopterin reductase-like flavin-dependent oxidoreductase (luciferase family)